VEAFKGRSRSPPRVHRKNQPCLESLAPSGLCRNTFVSFPGTGVDCTFPLPVPSGPPSFGLQGLLICLSGQKRENRYINGGAAGEGHTFLPYRDAPRLSLAEPLFFSVRLGFLASSILRGPFECRGANMPDPPVGGRGRCAPPDASLFTPAGSGEGTGLRRTASAGGQTGIPLRVTPPPPPTGVEDPPGRGGSSLRPTDVRSVLDAFRSEMLADVTRALSESPRRGESGGQASEQGGTSRSHTKRHHSRLRRPPSSSSSSDGSSSGSARGQGDRGATTPHGTDLTVPPIPVLQCSDDPFSRVLDYKTYRLRNRRASYGAAQARKMGRTTKNMKHSFGGFPPFSGKDPLKVFSWLRKLVKACDDNDVSEGMALYAIPHFLSGDAELRYTRELPDSGTALGVSSITSYPVAVNWFLQTYAKPHTLALAQDTFSRATIEHDETI